MAFTNTKGRYASFGIVTSLTPEIIDCFWDILDRNLKGVFKLDNRLDFQLVNSQGKTSFKYIDKYSQTTLIMDYIYPFDPFFPEIIYIVDNDGMETIILPHELDN